MTDTDPFIPCPCCDGEGGWYGLDGGYKITGPGMGDARPTESGTRCPRCEGEGEVHVNSLTDEEWSELS